MAESHRIPEEKGEPVVIDRVFIRTQATQAMKQFFRPLTIVFEERRVGEKKAPPKRPEPDQ